MDRRQFLATNALAGLLSVSASTSAASAGLTSAPNTQSSLPKNPGIDRARAAYVMRNMSLDALVLSRAENVRYATGAIPATTKLGFSDASYAIIPADPTIPIGLLVYQFPYYFSVADSGLLEGVEPHLVALGQSTERIVFGDDPNSGPTPRELNRRAALEDAGTIHPHFPAALKAALPASIVGSGSIGCDTIEALQLIESGAPGAKSVHAESAIRHLRLVKTPWEIAAMSRAAQINRDAAHLAAHAIRAGDTIDAVQRSFYNHAIALGNQPQFMAVDGVLAEDVADPVRDGTSVLIDCVSSRYGYNGDYGRTVFLGEPRKQIAAKTRAIGQAWTELRNELRPGLTFSEVSSRGAAILASIDSNIAVPFGPHSVGLKHTEQPVTGLDGAPLDVRLEAGMIISVDCPLMESSQQGTVHLEDLMLITPDGARPIHSVEEQIIIV